MFGSESPKPHPSHSFCCHNSLNLQCLSTHLTQNPDPYSFCCQISHISTFPTHFTIIFPPSSTFPTHFTVRFPQSSAFPTHFTVRFPNISNIPTQFTVRTPYIPTIAVISTIYNVKIIPESISANNPYQSFLDRTEWTGLLGGGWGFTQISA